MRAGTNRRLLVALALLLGSLTCGRDTRLSPGSEWLMVAPDGITVLRVRVAKKEGDTLTGVELQTTKYSEGIPDNLPAPRRPLPFQYQSTGAETRFTNLLEPDARSRATFSFHRPETLDQWLTQELQHPGSTLRARLCHLPELMTEGLRPAQIAFGTVAGSAAQMGLVPPGAQTPNRNGCGVGANPRAWSGLKPSWPVSTTVKPQPGPG